MGGGQTVSNALLIFSITHCAARSLQEPTVCTPGWKNNQHLIRDLFEDEDFQHVCRYLECVSPSACAIMRVLIRSSLLLHLGAESC